jgi:hypothetical protein
VHAWYAFFAARPPRSAAQTRRVLFCTCFRRAGFLAWPSRRWLAGFVQSRSGSTDCMNCDYIGDSYQEDMNETACIPCPKNTQRYLRLLSGANKTACQCQKGASDSSPPVRIFANLLTNATHCPFAIFCLPVPRYACGAHTTVVADVHALLPHAMVRRGSVAVFAISVNTYDFFALRAGSYSPTGRAGEARRSFACVACANCTGKVVDCLSGVRLVPAWSNVRRIPAATV